MKPIHTIPICKNVFIFVYDVNIAASTITYSLLFCEGLSNTKFEEQFGFIYFHNYCFHKAYLKKFLNG